MEKDLKEKIENNEVALSFKNLTVSLENPTKALLYNVSGYVKKGSITAGS